MKTRDLTQEQIRREGLKVLADHLGPEGMVRFLQQFETGSGDYVKERDTLFPEKSVAEVMKLVRERRKSRHKK